MANVPRETSKNKYDAVVIGAGLSGCESAAVLNKYDLKTLVINISMDNPAFIKSVNRINIKNDAVIRNINKYEKYFLRNIKKTALLKRISEKEENYIIDKKRFSLNYKLFLETCKNIDTRQGLVEKITITDDSYKVFNIFLNDGEIYNTKYIIASCGTFFNAFTKFGKNRLQAGRNGEISSKSLPGYLEKLKISFSRMTTSIPASIDGKNININKDCTDPSFNAANTKAAGLQVFKTYARKGLIISSLIEYFTKNYNYTAEKKDGFISFYLYPESRETKEFIIENFFSSKKETIQEKAINKIYCLEEAVMTKPSYLIEYDGVKKEQLSPFFESKKINNLYFPGEINGTGDYVEIALQGVFSAGDIVNKYYKKELINFK